MQTINTSPWLKPDLPFPLVGSDRDSDVFDLGSTLLVVASDRISAAGYSMPQGIPDKGRLLAGIARFWFGATRDIVPNVLITTEVSEYPAALQPFREGLEGRSALARKVRPIPLGCTVRGYLAGSAFADYLAEGSVSGIALSGRLKLATRLPEPIFTPSIKIEGGHRRNITMAEMMNRVGAHLTHRLKDCSLALYMRGYHLAWERDIILADARFEFGQLENGRLILTDEVLTPDTSRYWEQDRWKPGASLATIDRRCLLEHLATRADWNGTSPPPNLPPDIVDAIRESYLNLARRFGAVA